MYEVSPLPQTAPTEKPEPTTRWSRRSFLAGTGVGIASAVAAGAAIAGCGSTAPYVDAAGQAETDVLNFALNLEYLEATFYNYLVYGTDIDQGLVGGGPAPQNPPAKLTFPNQQITDLFAELCFDEVSHVQALRSVLSTLAVPRPQINFAALATITASNYLQHARLFEDVGVTAYAGAAASLTGGNVTAAAQILATEGFHAGALRLIVIQQNAPYPATLTGYVPADGYDIIPADLGSIAAEGAGPTSAKGGFFATQATGTTGQTSSYSGFAFRRTTSQVLAILYGSSTAGTAKGGFFPSGLNGNIVTV